MTAPPSERTDVDPQLVESLAPQCEVLTVYVQAGVATRGERCTNPARWVVRSWCHCGRMSIDLVCDQDVKIVDSCLQRCELCGCVNPPARRQVEAL